MKFQPDHFFKRSKGQVIFTGKIMTIDIPDRYGKLGWLNWGEQMEVIGIFTMVINEDISVGYNCQALITTMPSSTERINIDGSAYVRLIYNKNDVFLVSEDIIKQNSIPYNILNEFIFLGNLPAWMNYKNSYELFENTSALTGVNFSADRVYFHVMLSHCWRDRDNVMKMYRNTGMHAPGIFIPMRSTPYSALTTMARTIGSFDSDGITSAIVSPTEEVSDLENIMRD